MVLQCLDDSSDETWLRQVHAVIYFDPDGTDAELYNATVGTTFDVSSTEHDGIVKVPPTGSFRLRAEHSWVAASQHQFMNSSLMATGNTHHFEGQNGSVVPSRNCIDIFCDSTHNRVLRDEGRRFGGWVAESFLLRGP